MDNNTQPLFGNDPNTNNQQQNQQPQTLDDVLTIQRQVWVKEVEDMNENMKSLPKVDELLNTIYTKRQKAVDYYFGLNNVIAKHTKNYRANYNNMFNNIKINGYNGMRFTTDQSINRQIETDLQDLKETIELLSNQSKFMEETIKTLDNLIYGINLKVKIFELMNGVKF